MNGPPEDNEYTHLSIGVPTTQAFPYMEWREYLHTVMVMFTSCKEC